MNNYALFNNFFSVQLKEKIAVGDQQASRQLFNLYSKILVQFAYSFVKAKDVALELVDSVFVKLWKQKEQVTNIQNLKVYLYTATKNASLNYLSQKAFHSTTEPFDNINIQINDEPTPEQQLISSKLLKQITAAVDELPPKCRIIFKLVREDGLKEAFFDIIKDAHKPFLVHTAPGIDIRVPGTAFHLKSYPDEPLLVFASKMSK